jgi:hypothetical protein
MILLEISNLSVISYWPLIGRPMNEVDKSHWFLYGLGTEFASFSSTQLSLSSLTPIHDLVLLAESHDLFQKSLESQSLPIVAFIATRSLSGH